MSISSIWFTSLQAGNTVCNNRTHYHLVLSHKIDQNQGICYVTIAYCYVTKKRLWPTINFLMWKWTTTLQRLGSPGLETDRPVTIPTARGQTWQGRVSCSGLTQIVKSWESPAYVQLCNGSAVGRW